MSESELLYAAASAKFGIIVTGSVKRFRDARSALRDDIALSDKPIGQLAPVPAPAAPPAATPAAQ